MAKFYVLVCPSDGVVGWEHSKERIQMRYDILYGQCPFCGGKIKTDSIDCRMTKKGEPNRGDLVRKYGLVRA